MSKWDQNEILTLRAMWPNYSARDIAEILVRSRSAIIGKANRMGLPRKPLPGEEGFVYTQRMLNRISNAQKAMWSEERKKEQSILMRERHLEIRKYNARCRTQT